MRTTETCPYCPNHNLSLTESSIGKTKLFCYNCGWTTLVNQYLIPITKSIFPPNTKITHNLSKVKVNRV